MKRIIIALCLACMLFSVACATDYTAMTDDELKAECAAIRNELYARGHAAESGTVLLDRDGILICMTGEPVITQRYSHRDTLYLMFPVTIVNNSSRDITDIFLKNESVNGWAVVGYFDPSDVAAGKKAKGEMMFDLSASDITAEDVFEDMEFSFVIIDSDHEDIIPRGEKITVYAKAETPVAPSVEGTWKLTTFRVDESVGMLEEGRQNLQNLIDSDALYLSYTFSDGRITMEIRLYDNGHIQTGAYRMEDGTLYVTTDINPDHEGPMVCNITDDTMELPLSDTFALILTRAE